MKLTDYIRTPEQLGAADIEDLSRLVEQYPYFQAARLLLLRGLYQMQDERFGPALREAAIHLPDRAKLFQLIEGSRYQLAPETRLHHVHPVQEPAVDRTQSLIDTFLAQQEEQGGKTRTKVADVTTDYMAYLEQLEDLPQADQEKEEDIIDQFMQTTGGKIVLPKEEPSAALTSVQSDEEEKGAQDDYFTETLARIYVKQRKYTKAIEIIRRINLNYPKKSSYFADQIRFLEKLALLERFNQDPK